MAFDRWPSPHTLVLGSVWLVASCTALGITASHSSSSSAALSSAAPSPAAAPKAKAALASPVVTAVATATAPCSDDMVLVERTCVDRYEAHLLEQHTDGSRTPYPAHQRPEKARYLAASAPGTKPQAFISQREARAACENTGKRLCKLTEWYRACTGSAKTTYPYGATYAPRRCNVGKTHLLSKLHGADSRNWSYAAFNDPQLATTPGFLALTGEYRDCASAEGVHDMVGNLHEWVDDLVDRTLPTKLPVPAIIQRRIGRNAGNGIFMGGFFSTMNEHGSGCTYTTAAHDPRYHDYSTGFRCCRDAEQAPAGE